MTQAAATPTMSTFRRAAPASEPISAAGEAA